MSEDVSKGEPNERRNEQISEDERQKAERLYIQSKKGIKYAEKDVKREK